MAEPYQGARGRTLSVFMVVGEESGDALGAQLMQALRQRHAGTVEFAGVAGSRMSALGLESLFPLSEIAVMGMSAVLARLPAIIRRVHETVDAALAANPDILVIIDSPDFTHAVARRVRRKAPHIPIVDYVSPSVWAWRPGRARKMAVYVDHLLAILPFEPEVHARLGGPACTYVGHPLIERLGELRPGEEERREPNGHAPVLLVLPGSRASETDRLLAPFRDTVVRLAEEFPALEIVMPSVGHLEERIRAEIDCWPVSVRVVSGEAEKFAAFRRADAALAASGTVTLELAIAAVPMAVAYKLDWFYRQLKKLNYVIPIVTAPSMVLPNIVVGSNVVPEFLEEEVTAERLVPVVASLLRKSDARSRQLEAFHTLEAKMVLDNGEAPSTRAARIVSEVAGCGGAAEE